MILINQQKNKIDKDLNKYQDQRTKFKIPRNIENVEIEIEKDFLG